MSKRGSWEKFKDGNSQPFLKRGREVVIKAVAQAILAYLMNIFKFPANVCNDLDSLISKFWWGHKGEERYRHWISRDTLGLPKAVGGLGLRSFMGFNDALLAKQCWQLIQNPNSLWARVFKAHYFPHCFLLDAKRGGKASWAWSSLLSGRDLLLNDAQWQIMNSNEARVWLDRWLPTLSDGHPIPSGSVQISRNTWVESLISPVNEEWDIDFLKPFISTLEYDAILETQLGDLCMWDRLVWPLDKRGVYSVKSGYHCAYKRVIPRVNLGSSSSLSILGSIWKVV